MLAFITGRLNLPGFDVKIMERGVLKGHWTPVRLDQVGVQPLSKVG